MSYAHLEARFKVITGRVNRLYKLSEQVQGDITKLELFKAHCSDLEHLRRDFEETHVELGVAARKSKRDFDVEAHDKLIEDFDMTYYQVKEIYARITKPSSTSGNDNGPPVKALSAKLPKLQLPTFSGINTDWTTFHDLYVSLIHTNKTLTPVERFQYLLTTLSGEPLTLLKSLPVSDENYPLAWATLTERYQDVRSIATTHLEKIMQFPGLTSRSPQNLRALVDTFKENLGALNVLKFPVCEWSFILLNLTLNKLDRETRLMFELAHTATKLPSFDQLLEFLENQCKALSSANQGISLQTSASTRHIATNRRMEGKLNSPVGVRRSFYVDSNQGHCSVCQANHSIYKCPVFTSKTPTQRRDWVKSNNLCFNCLKGSHQVKECSSKFKCPHCNQTHHTLLHIGSINQGTDTCGQGSFSSNQRFTSSHTDPTHRDSRYMQGDATHQAHSPGHEGTVTRGEHINSLTTSSVSLTTVLLGTAVVQVKDGHGAYQKVRVLIDCASQSSFITEDCAHRLCLPRRKLKIPIKGISQSTVQTNKGVVICEVKPCGVYGPQLITEAIILSKITSGMPSTMLSKDMVQEFAHLQLADPHFHVPGPIDILLGADVYPEIFDGGRYSTSSNCPSGLHSIFGWIIIGRIGPQPLITSSVSSFFVATEPSLDNVLRRFWEVEELPVTKHIDPNEAMCEAHYVTTHTRDNEGRYIVRLPFKDAQPELGESHQQAVKRLIQLERRLARYPQLKEQYVTFLKEYEELGHMQRIEPSMIQDIKYYIPHHCVSKESSSTTKLRVVFDASAATSSGQSLNDTLLKGPKLQREIVEIVMNFRFHPIVLTTDICKMYRQILVTPDDRHYQVILWRESPDQQIQEYQLNTVTYGVSSAPYLAMRSLRQLASDEKLRYPRAAQVLCKDIFVDDIVTGADSVESALSLQTELIELLSLGGFQLRKWSSNHPEVLKRIPNEHREVPLMFEEDGDQIIKILGLEWDPTSDSFSYHVHPSEITVTKRAVLSNIARIFDPVGWLSPVVFWAKAFMQILWTIRLDWDEPLPPELGQGWQRFCSNFHVLTHVKINRFLPTSDAINCQLHGFCDASIKGYAAVVYLRTTTGNGEIQVNNLIAKSRVAPVKSLSLPRLELCGAQLLATLMEWVQQNLKQRLQVSTVYTWSDSTIVLAWIQTSPHLLKTFVANRVAQIQAAIPAQHWRHVPSNSNPADCASRGLHPEELTNFHIWWTGPEWLKQPISSWPKLPEVTCQVELPELKIVRVTSLVAEVNTWWADLLKRFSSWVKLQRVIAFLARFIQNSKVKNQDRCKGPLLSKELKTARMLCIKQVQQQAFESELEEIKKGRECSPRVRGLNPFLDQEGLLRVGGRLRHSSLRYDTKHPLLLPKNSHITDIIVDHYHVSHFHAGLRTTHSLIQDQYWILSARTVIKTRIFKCMRCFRFKAPALQPFMGDLPAMRVQQSRPFVRVGVDYGGPFQIKSSELRNSKVLKAYLCLFVCLATKAVHLEVVSDLSTRAFLDAVLRFISRRGMCSDIYSDCGTNFVGAKRHFTEIQRHLESHTETKVVTDKLSVQGINWHFNPPSAPHFGGLWEAGIKSAKTHLKRVVGDQTLTFESLSTLFIQIEAVLNSRPLCALSADPNDLDPLTPGHFIVGHSLTRPPEEIVTELPTNRLKRWQLIQQAYQHFWQRWSREYIHTLQQRQKWTTNKVNLQEGQLVLIKEDNLPPLRWLLGRVAEVYPGRDGITRVVSVRTEHGTLKRPVVKLCPLPNQ